MTTTTSEDQRERARNLAQKHLTDLLAGDRSPYDFDRNRDFRMLADLVNTAENFRGLAKRIADDLDSASRFAHGESGRMNSLGVLQGDATRIDALAMLFHKQIEYAKDVLYDFYMDEIQKVDAEWEIVEAFGPQAAECVEQAKIHAQVTGSGSATHSVSASGDATSLAPTSSATVRRIS